MYLIVAVFKTTQIVSLKTDEDKGN